MQYFLIKIYEETTVTKTKKSNMFFTFILLIDIMLSYIINYNFNIRNLRFIEISYYRKKEKINKINKEIA